MDSTIQSVGDVALQQGLIAENINRAMAARAHAKGASIDATAKEFEAMFMAQMLQPMWEGVEVDQMFGGGHGEEVMRGLLVQEYGKAVASNSGSGLSDAIKAEMIRMQSEANHKSVPVTTVRKGG